MNFTWANQFAKNALKNAQKKIDSVLDITVEEADEDEELFEDENDMPAGSSRFGALSEEEEDGDGASGAWEEHDSSTNFSSYDDEPQGLGVVDSEPNPIRDSHHPASCGHSTASTSPDEGCSGGDEHEASPLNEEEHPVESVIEERHLETEESTNTLILMDASPSVVMVTEGDDDNRMSEEGSITEDMSSQGQHHDETLTIASSDIEVLRQGDSWSVMSMSSSAFCAETPLAASASISLEPLSQQDGGSKCNTVTNRDAEVEIARLKSHIQHQERRIGDLLEQNKKLNKKSNDILALKAARNKQTSTEAKLMKKLSEKEEELASLLLEGEKLAETNGKLTKELKRLRASLTEQEQLAKKGAQAEIDRDLAREELRGLTAENAKLRASMKSMESDSWRVKAADEILVNDLKRREERLEKMTSEVQDAESAKNAAENEVKRLQSLMEQMSSKADEREISTKGVEEITRGLNAAIGEEKQKNERHLNYIASLEKRLAVMMESQRDAAQMVAIANSPLLESIRELEANAKSVETTHEIAINEKDLFISSLSKAKDELTQENKKLMNELTKVRSGNDEASHAMVDISDRLQHAENDNQRLRGSVERSERLLEGLKTSLSSKEVEIDKLYLRLRQEAETAQRQSIEKQERIDQMVSRCEVLDRDMLVLRERTEQTFTQAQQSTVKRRMISPVSNTSLVDPLPYISPAAAQTELTEVMVKYEQAMRQISSLQATLATVQEDNLTLTSLRNEFKALRMRYESLLEAHGEKIERIEELELDIADVKKLFRDQMELLLGKN